MNVQKKGDRVYLSGVINENSDFASLLNEPSPLKLDFRGIQRINSIGVRSWMRFLTQWGEKPLEYFDCSIAIVDQLSIIGSLRGIKSKIATIRSAYIPTECQSCNRDGETLVTREDYKLDPSLDKLLAPCPACGGKVSFLISDFVNLFVP